MVNAFGVHVREPNRSRISQAYYCRLNGFQGRAEDGAWLKPAVNESECDWLSRRDFRNPVRGLANVHFGSNSGGVIIGFGNSLLKFRG